MHSSSPINTGGIAYRPQTSASDIFSASKIEEGKQNEYALVSLRIDEKENEIYSVYETTLSNPNTEIPPLELPQGDLFFFKCTNLYIWY